MSLNITRTRQCLQEFEFRRLFVEELGWNNPPHTLRSAETEAKGGLRFRRTPVAVLSGIHVFEIVSVDGLIPDEKGRASIHATVSVLAAENLLIFIDAARTQSLWYWVKREEGKSRPRDHLYVKGQPGDLFLSKLATLVVDISELDAKGDIPLTEVARRLKNALDVERVTKAFFRDFQTQHLVFLELIEGIPDVRDRRWYASVLLNRLMFAWFLEKKGFLNVGKNPSGEANYLTKKFAASVAAKKDCFFSHFLRDLFFEGFAKPESKRAPIGSLPLGDIPYLNGGLFLAHRIETSLEGAGFVTGPYKIIRIPDAAFAGLFSLFKQYSWSLDDTPGGDDKEINPDVLGYIFEKYINQKEFGAYYTRPEITEYLCEQTIHQLVLDAAAKWTSVAQRLHAAGVTKGPAPRVYETAGDLLLHADGPLSQHLLQEVLPSLSLLDPACGSGAFLVAALKTLLNLATGLIGRCEALGHRPVLQWIEYERCQHKAPLAYWLKKKIITENLYGVDLMEEAVEIAKLRLFLTLVASAETRDQLEPLPNIDFKLLPGNSLIGLLHVDPSGFDAGKSGRAGEQLRTTLLHETELGLTVESATAPTQKEKQAEWLAQERIKKYAALLAEKNQLVALYQRSTSIIQDLAILRDEIEAKKAAARDVLDRQLLREFQGLGIEFSQATWNTKKQAEGRPEKRRLTLDDIRALRPFHWAYEFDEIIVNRGGFDAIITNPPWEVFEKNDKEFFHRYEGKIQKNALRMEDWVEQRDALLENKVTREAWLDYLSSYSHQAEWFKAAPQYRNQTSVIDGRISASKNDFYKLFLEQCVNLLRGGARCGIVIPGSIYNNKGATQLRRMLFERTQVTGFFGFENRERIFEGVDSRFKFIVLSFENGRSTTQFPAAFMRHDVADLAQFPAADDVWIDLATLKRLSPSTLSILEFQSQLDAQLVLKLYRHPVFRPPDADHTFPSLYYELNLTNDHGLFITTVAAGAVPLYEGKIFHQFDHRWDPPRYWARDGSTRTQLIASRKRVLSGLIKEHGLDLEVDDIDILLGADSYRIALRDVASNTNERTLISSVLPRGVFCPHTVAVERVYEPYVENEELHANHCPFTNAQRCYLIAILNSFTLDYVIRQQVTAHLSFFYIYNLPIPRLPNADPAFRPLVERAARLVGTTAEFDDLLKEIFGPRATHRTHGESTPEGRAKLRAEIDARVAHLYALTEPEFTHILSTFPLVSEEIKLAALAAFRR